MSVRNVEGDKLERMRAVFERRAQAQAVVTQLTLEIETAFVMLGINVKREQLDLRTGEIHPLDVPTPGSHKNGT